MSGIGTPNMAARAQISIEFSLRKSLRKIRGTRKSAHQVHHKTVTSPHSRRPRHTFPAKITCKLTRNRVLGLGMGYVWDWEQEHGGSGWSVGGRVLRSRQTQGKPEKRVWDSHIGYVFFRGNYVAAETLFYRFSGVARRSTIFFFAFTRSIGSCADPMDFPFEKS